MKRRGLFVGMALATLAGLLLGRAQPVLAAPPSSWSSATALDHDSDLRSDAFGRTVAVSGDLAVVSDSLQEVGHYLGVGQIYTYTHTDGAWPREGSPLVLPDGKPEDFFGYCVALSGGTLLASVASHLAEANPVPGSVYAFSHTASGWQQQGPKLVANDGYPADGFGTALAVSGDTAVISAPGQQGEYKVYVFVRQGGAWAQQGPALSHPGGAQGRYFGTSVAISGDTLLIGAAAYADPATTGAAFVFVRTAGTWTQQGPPLSSGVELDQYGYAVALNGDTAVVGAPGANGGDGAAHIYQRDATGVWTQQGPTQIGPPASNGQFGSTVSVWGTQAVIAAPNLEGTNYVGSGALFLFARVANIWAQSGVPQHVSTRTGVDMDHNLGQALAMSGPNVLVGSLTYYGSAYLVRACASGSCCTGDLECPLDEYCSAGGSCQVRQVSADGGANEAEGGATNTAGAAGVLEVAGAPAGGAPLAAGGAASAGAPTDDSCANTGTCTAPVPDRAISSCGCRVGSRPTNGAPTVLAVLLGLVLLRRRRRT